MVGGALEAALPRKLFVCLRAAPICVYGLALSRMQAECCLQMGHRRHEETFGLVPEDHMGGVL